MQKEPMTPKGYQKLTEELNFLKNTQRAVVAKEIQEARELGDLKENAEYHAAKEKQSMMEAKIAQLEDMSARSQIINPSELDHKRISFGSSVNLLDQDTDQKLSYTITGVLEANIEKGYISYHTPLAKILLGKTAGEEVEAVLPNATKYFEILDVFYKEIEVD